MAAGGREGRHQRYGMPPPHRKLLLPQVCFELELHAWLLGIESASRCVRQQQMHSTPPFTPSSSRASLGWGCNLHRLHALLHILQRVTGWDRRRHIQTQPRQPQHSAALDRIGSTKCRAVEATAAAVANWTKGCRHFIRKHRLTEARGGLGRLTSSVLSHHQAGVSAEALGAQKHA